jgi:hypothetical protein
LEAIPGRFTGLSFSIIPSWRVIRHCPQIDGVIGSATIEAVRKFQADHGLTRTGKIDPKLLDALGINYKAQS